MTNTSHGSLAIGLTMLLATTCSAQGLLLRVHRDTGAMELTGTSATAVNLGGYRISSTRGAIDVAGFNGLSDDVAGWQLTGNPPVVTVNGVAELLNDPFGTTPISNAATQQLGAGYNAQQAILAAGFGVDIEVGDLGLQFYDTELRTTLAGVIEYLGEKTYNNLGVTIDLADGTATLTNDSPFEQVLTGYLLETATAGTLSVNLASFNGLRDEAGGSAFEAPTTLDGANLGELDPSGVGITVGAGQSYSLGVVGGYGRDVDFTFLLQGAGQSSRVGFVNYINDKLFGDFNDDGVVDAADYTLWRDNLGAADESALNFNGDGGDVALSDYELWKDNFGAAFGQPAVAFAGHATPEPSALALAALAALAGFRLGRPRR